MNRHLFTDFDTRFMDAADLILQAMSDNTRVEFPMEFKYSNLGLPRQCGKSTYLRQLARQLTIGPVYRKKLKIAYFENSHNSESSWSDNLEIDVYPSKDYDNLSKFDVDVFVKQNYDILLFDEVSPVFTSQLVHHQKCQDMASRSKYFLAFGMHTMDHKL
jgi:hypothetical protein